MTKTIYQFAVLRYIHDPATEEFFNIGIVVYTPDVKFLRAKVNPSVARLSHAFAQQVNSEDYRRVVGFIERAIQQQEIELHPQKLDLFTPTDQPLHLRLQTILPADDSSFVFAGYGAGWASDLDGEVERLYGRLVAKYNERTPLPTRTDEQVWQQFVRKAANVAQHALLHHLEPVTITTTNLTYPFEHAWKNERWHVIEPVSLDLSSEISIEDKAMKWVGRATILSQSQSLGSMTLLLGAPQKRNLLHAYRDALENLRRTFRPEVLEVIEEQEGEAFAQRLGQTIALHQTE